MCAVLQSNTPAAVQDDELEKALAIGHASLAGGHAKNNGRYGLDSRLGLRDPCVEVQEKSLGIYHQPTSPSSVVRSQVSAMQEVSKK